MDSSSKVLLTPGTMQISRRGSGRRYVESPLTTIVRVPVAADGEDSDLDDLVNTADVEAVDDIDFQSGKSKPSATQLLVRQSANGLMCGLVNAILNIPCLIGYTSIIFHSKVFHPHQANLVKLVLWSSVVHQTVFTLTSQLPFAIGQVQDAGLIFLSAMATSCVQLVPVGADGLPGPMAVPTACCTLAMSTALLGCALIITGKMRAASLVQYLPMPVVSGYLGFIGIFCVEAGLALSTGLDIGTNPRTWSSLYSVDALWLGGPAVVAGLALLAVSRGKHAAWAVPATFLAVPSVFYLVMHFAGISFEAARADHWLTEPVPQVSGLSGFKSLFSVFDFDLVYWPAVVRQLPTWLGMYFVVAFSSCLDVAAVEMEHGKPLDVNHELGQVVGVSNLLSGVTGGFTGSYIISQTVFTFRTCPDTRICGWVCAASSLAMVFMPVSATDYVPKFVFGAALIFVGLDLMHDWLYLPMTRLACQEGLVVAASFLFINITGLEYGLVLGVAFSAVLFIVEHASNPSVVRVHRVSRTLRNPEQRAYLRRRYGQVVQLQLNGHLFFGSAVALLAQVKKYICVPAEAAPAKPLDEAPAWMAGQPTECTPLVTTGPRAPAAGVPLARLTSVRRVVDHDPPSSLGGSGPSPLQLPDTAASHLHRSGSVRLKKTRFVVFDFSGVPGVDTTAVRTCFLTLRHQLRQYGIGTVFSGMSPSVQSQFQRNDLLDDDSSCKVCPTFDDALEWCENRLLSDVGAPRSALDQPKAAAPGALPALSAEEVRGALVAAFEQLSPSAPGHQLGALAALWEPRRHGPGSILCTPGAPAADLEMLLCGSVELRAPPPGSSPETAEPEECRIVARLRPGMFVGDVDWHVQQRWSFFAITGSEGAITAALPALERDRLPPESRMVLQDVMLTCTCIQLLTTFGEK